MKRLLSLVLLLLGCSGIAAAQEDPGARLTYFKVEKQDNNLVLSWQAEAEQDILRYELMRRTLYSREQFVKIQDVAVHGPGKPYRFVDDQVYKATTSEQVDYQLVAVLSDGARKELASTSINYTSTAIRRTWGSIKAMFQ